MAAPESWAKAIVKLGVGSSIALYAVWVLSHLLTGDVKATRAVVESTRLVVDQHVRTTERLLATQTVLINLTLQQCSNAAATRAERDACFAALVAPPPTVPPH
jgi:hypothetical protein